jgi:hypothetical protein
MTVHTITTYEELIAFSEPLLADIFRAVTAMMRAELEELKYDPNQPRVPAGQPTGGQWTSDLGGIAKEYGWADVKTLQEHVKNHSKDFNSRSARDYARQAKSFYERGFKEKLPMVQDRSGIVRIYDPKTNSFGSYNKDGTTRTFYKPADGVKYYEQQVKRYGVGRGRVINPLPEKPPTTRIQGGSGRSLGSNSAPPLNPRLINKPFVNN